MKGDSPMAVEPALSYFLSYITLNIPPEILNMCVDYSKTQTVDQFIKDIILEKYVFKDINARAGKEIKVNVNPAWRRREMMYCEDTIGISDYVNIGVYEIPPQVREFRPIVNVITISGNFGIGFFGMGGVSGNNIYSPSINSYANNLIESRTYQNSPPKPDVILMDSTMIKVIPDSYVGGFMLHCVIGYDQNFTNINTSLLHELRSLMLLQTKKWIYTNFVIKIDANEVRSGMEIGAFKDIVSTYASAEEDYNLQIAKCVAANGYDKQTMYNRIRMAI